MSTLENAAVEAMQEKKADKMPCTVAAKWICETPKPSQEKHVLKTSHGEFSVGLSSLGKTYIYFHLTLCEFVPLTIEDAKRECAELLLPQLEEVLDEVRLLAKMSVKQ
jgi:hypothetical protein